MKTRLSVEHLSAVQEGHEIKVTVDALPEKGYCVTGIALNEQGKPVSHTKRVCKTSSKKSIPGKKQVVVNRINAALAAKASKSQTRTSADGLDEDNPFVQAYHRVLDSGNPINENWNEDSRHAAMTYFYRHILVFLQKLDDMEFLASDREKLEQEIFDDINANKHSRGVDRTMRQTAQRRLIEAGLIYDAMRKEDPSLPAIKFCLEKHDRPIQAETLKSLPREVRHRFASELERRAKDEPEMVFGAVLMWDAGLRTGEAAAVSYDIDIRFINKNHGVVYVEWQEKDGLRSPILKTKNSYRMVPLSYWGTTMLQRCVEAVPPKDIAPNAAPRRKRDLSEWIRALLTECGCDEAFWQLAQEYERQNPDRDDDGKMIYDISAYVLRRERCGIWRNVCGLTQTECDYLLGHAVRISQRKRVDMRTTEAQISVAKKLERFVYASNVSDHPYHRAFELIHGSDIDVIPFEAMRFVNTAKVTIRVNLSMEAKIVGEPILLLLPTDAQIDRIHRRSSKTIVRRPNEPIIGTEQEGILWRM